MWLYCHSAAFALSRGCLCAPEYLRLLFMRRCVFGRRLSVLVFFRTFGLFFPLVCLFLWEVPLALCCAACLIYLSAATYARDKYLCWLVLCVECALPGKVLKNICAV